MRTKKISLTEFRKLVKNIIKEESNYVSDQLKNAQTLDEIDQILEDNSVSKGELMKIAFDNNTRNVDSALPKEYWEKLEPYGGTYYFVMDYQTNGHGKLVHLGEKILGIETDWEDKLFVQESVKPKTQKIKLSEVRQMVRKSLRENNQKKSNFPSSTEVNDLIKDLNLNKINGMYTKNGGAFSLEKKDDDKSKINMSIEKVKNFPSIKINYKNKSTVIGIPNGIITKGIKNKIKNILNESMDDPKSWGVGSFGITKDVDLSKKSFESLNDDQKTKENLLKRIEELSNQLHVSYAGNDDHHFEKQVLIHILKRKTRGNIKSITDEIIEDAILDVEEHYDFDIFD
jgi:hypothetical protein